MLRASTQSYSDHPAPRPPADNNHSSRHRPRVGQGQDLPSLRTVRPLPPRQLHLHREPPRLTPASPHPWTSRNAARSTDHCGTTTSRHRSTCAAQRAQSLGGWNHRDVNKGEQSRTPPSPDGPPHQVATPAVMTSVARICRRHCRPRRHSTLPSDPRGTPWRTTANSRPGHRPAAP